MTVLSQASSSVYVRPTRSIGGLILDVTVSERHEDELEITGHPVEQGAEITDHAFVKPVRVTIEAGHSDSGGSSSGDSRSVETYEALLALQKKREPFDLVTGKRVYSNMLIKTLSVTTDISTEHVLMVRAELQEVIITTIQTVEVPRSRQKHASKTSGVAEKGQKQLKPTSSSALKQIFG